MGISGAVSTHAHPAPFQHYGLGEAYDEMFDSGGEPRPHYQELYKTLLDLPADELRRRKQASDVTFLNQGITFTVYGREEGTERIFPPRSAAAHHHPLGVDHHRARPDAAHHRSQPVPERHLPRRQDPERRGCAARNSLHLQALSTADARNPAGARHLHHRGRHRPDPSTRRPLSWCWKTICACRAASPTC